MRVQIYCVTIRRADRDKIDDVFLTATGKLDARRFIREMYEDRLLKILSVTATRHHRIDQEGRDALQGSP